MSQVFDQVSATKTDGFHRVFELSMPLRWGDMDAFGHVNNTVYFRFMEEVRISWFRQLAIAGANVEGQGPVIVNASMEFLRQLHYPGNVIGSMFVGPPGRSSFDTRFELFRADDPTTLYARGTAKCVWIDYAAAKSVQIPELLRHAIETAAPGLQSRG
ncbi:thioesterase [Caballeronia mineralivorans PML1(12)]|uniref:Thioesterase n=1 Tax=Caballeronia mineralivorans PML1(12) TaxID=908627 RepID=A0A0J1CI37_9BURK|nr:acyl-CoA thioesterase [Caballeronia mineralivorans]KLU20322.1 thioesterase [Caballeronia mineralivorans PML1(12)]